ncbi:lysoplasmalogenase [Paenibacillus alvei]|uniref:Lysoplasmalogenase n=1 Tax=Paenibacillus alvei TaxID=44250 RepID=A0ABT4GRG8_PAEAL|nr:lysoplasmalogenase [Paenibacillus alvei]MCY9759262.1 lysoplasmalogenase [Paenibacillus alvei]MCY9766671.1 lysoplasmalogenase [Paenibacillus alvei]
MLRKWLIVAILVTGVTHLATLSLDSTILNWIFKLLPMALIIVLAVSSQPADKFRMYKILVVIGLIFSIAGDAFLLKNGNQWFMFGLSSFMVGHLLYVAAMIRRWEFSLLALLCVAPIGVYSWLIGWQLHNGIMADSGQSDLWLPVAVYVGVRLLDYVDVLRRTVVYCEQHRERIRWQAVVEGPRPEDVG